MVRKAAVFAVVIGVASLAGVAPVEAGKAGGITIDFNPSDDESTICHTVSGAIDFYFGEDGPGGTCPNEYFQARAQGGIIAPFTGPVQFCGFHDDGMFLYVGGQEVFRNMDEQGTVEPCNSTGTIDLVEGECYPLTMFYFEASGYAALELRWSWTEDPFEVIPASAYVDSCGYDNLDIDMSGLVPRASQTLPETGRDLDAFMMFAAAVSGLGVALTMWTRRRGAVASH